MLDNKNIDSKKPKAVGSFLVYIAVTFIMILQYKFFFIPSDRSSLLLRFNTDDCSVMIVVFTVLTLILYGFLKGRFAFNLNYYFLYSIFFFLIYFLVVLLFSIFKYPGLNVLRALSFYSYIFVLLFYFVLLTFFRKYNGYNYFILMLTVFNIILATLMIIAAIQYNYTGDMFLNIFTVDYGTMYARDGFIRIYSGAGMIMTSSVVSIGLIFSKGKYKLLHLINLALSFFHVFYVQRTRMVIIVLCGVLIVAMYLFETKFKFFRFFIITGLVILAIIAFSNEISFSTAEVSYVNRSYGFKYYIEYGLTHLFGIGTLTGSDTAYSTILHGSEQIAYISEVGIIGVLGNFGVIAFFWYFYIIAKFINIRVQKTNKTKACFITFYILSMFTQVPLGYYGMIFFPISMAICEYSAISEQEYKVEIKNA